MTNKKGSALLLRAARAKQRFWIEQRNAAKKAEDGDAADTAQRFIDEYEDFISLLAEHAGER